MAIYISQAPGGIGDLYALNGGTEGTATGTSVTFTNLDYPGLVLTLSGTGIIGTPSASWNITDISATWNGVTAWTLSGIIGVDGTPTSGPFDYHSIFQAAGVFNIDFVLWDSTNTLIGAPSGSNWLFGRDGQRDTLIARGGTVLMDGHGDFDTLVGASRGHDFFRFDSRLDNSFDTIRAYNVARDTIELDRGTFDQIPHLGVLTAAEFHSGLGAPSRTGADIVYNHGNGRLYYDDNGNHLGGLHLFAVIANHAALTAADFLVIA